MISEVYSTAFKTSYIIFSIPTMMVVISAIISSRSMGGTLGQGLKKLAAGSIIHTTLIMTYLAIERGNRGLLSEDVVKLFFLVCGVIGSFFLISGYLQIYKIAKSLKLFTT